MTHMYKVERKLFTPTVQSNLEAAIPQHMFNLPILVGLTKSSVLVLPPDFNQGVAPAGCFGIEEARAVIGQDFFASSLL
jgi:hypothetical protein